MTNRTQDIFARAYELEPEEREAFLSEACGNDAELRQEVEQLLTDASRADSFFGDDDEATLAADGSGKSSGKPSIPTFSSPTGNLTEKEGDIIGSYKLLQQIGEGGFGTVWMAEQSEPISRKVALKVIKAGMDTKEVLTRFEAERQAVALMDHPNIAKVLDAGATDSGRPWFAMELVKGIPVTQFCDEQKLNMKQRLALFSDICSAINHAHQKGVIHRDIKPSNVMVTLQSDKPEVKVIDFGIAKATHSKLKDKTLFTRFEQFMGTPAYMSPEQAELSGLDIDTRSDIYSLGVLLYELLAGRPPFDPKTLISAGFEEMRRIIREEEPKRPSHHLSTSSGDDATSITTTHGAEPRKLSRLVRGELDWIVMKAIEKDRSRRYETANAFAADIWRYLTNEPVLAAAPSAAYKFRKFTRRNKAAIGVAALITIVLIAATGASTQQAFEAHKARIQSERDKEEAEAISKYMIEVFQSPDPSRDGRTITVAETLGAAAKKLEIDFADLPEKNADLRTTIASTYQALGLYQEAIALQEKSRDYHLEVSGPEHPDTLMAMSNLAISYSAAGQWYPALELRWKVLDLRRKVLGEEHPDTLMAMSGLASSYLSAARLPEAIPLQRKALELSRKVLGEEHPITLSAMHNLGHFLFRANRGEEALELQERVLKLSRKTLGDEHPETLRAMNNLALSYQAVGRGQEALELREQLLELSRKVFGDDHPDTIAAIMNKRLSYTTSVRWNNTDDLHIRVIRPGDSEEPGISEKVLKVFGKGHPAQKEIEEAAAGRNSEPTEILRDVNIIGNSNFSSRSLKKVMAQKEKGGRTDSESLQKDVRAIEDLYRDSGYVNARVVNVARLRVNSKYIDLVISIDEGQIHKVSAVEVTGVKSLSLKEDILPSLKTRVGQPFSGSALRDDIEMIRYLYGARGAQVIPKLNPGREPFTVKISLKVKEGWKPD